MIYFLKMRPYYLPLQCPVHLYDLLYCPRVLRIRNYIKFKKCFSRSFSTHSLNHTHTLVEETPGDVDTRKCPFEHKPCDQWTTCSSFIAATSLCYLMVMGAFNSGTRYEKFMLTRVLHDKARSRVAAHL